MCGGWRKGGDRGGDRGVVSVEVGFVLFAGGLFVVERREVVGGV